MPECAEGGAFREICCFTLGEIRVDHTSSISEMAGGEHKIRRSGSGCPSSPNLLRRALSSVAPSSAVHSNGLQPCECDIATAAKRLRESLRRSRDAGQSDASAASL